MAEKDIELAENKSSGMPDYGKSHRETGVGGVIRRGAADYLYAADSDVDALRSYFEQRAQTGGAKEREQYHKVTEAMMTMEATFHKAQSQAPAENGEEAKFREAYFKFVMVNNLDPRQQRGSSEDKFLETLTQRSTESFTQSAHNIMRSSYMVSEMMEVLKQEAKDHSLPAIPNDSSKLETDNSATLAKLSPVEKIIAVNKFAETLPEHQREVYHEAANKYALSQGIDISVIKDRTSSLEA